MKKVVLLDMDGTLTPPRKRMERNILRSLEELQNNNFEIAIVSGSDLDYIKEQCDIMWDICLINYESLHILPCNGTKYYKFSSKGFEKKYELDMKNHIGVSKYGNIIKALLDSQTAVRYSLGGSSIPLSGTFIQYRGSMVNWCPIGRDASDDERKIWIELDNKYKIRKAMHRRLLSSPAFADITIKMGGETSFDIYPKGWDKTYAWKVFKEYQKIYFVGDRCSPSGNDFEAYQMAGQNGFETSGPQKTIEIISEIINR